MLSCLKSDLTRPIQAPMKFPEDVVQKESAEGLRVSEIRYLLAQHTWSVLFLPTTIPKKDTEIDVACFWVAKFAVRGYLLCQSFCSNLSKHQVHRTLNRRFEIVRRETALWSGKLP